MIRQKTKICEDPAIAMPNLIPSGFEMRSSDKSDYHPGYLCLYSRERDRNGKDKRDILAEDPVTKQDRNSPFVRAISRVIFFSER